jgi:drug/metabolite transporter (DMT)-like permease
MKYVKKCINKKRNKTLSFKPILFIVLCSLLISSGQIFFKLGADKISSVIDIFSNVPVLLGFILCIIGSLFLIVALKYGELSLVYPFMALNFIWVTLASIFLFNESVYIITWIGVLCIIVGVSLLGLGDKK